VPVNEATPVGLFDTDLKFIGIDDYLADSKLRIELEQFIRAEELRGVVYLSTYLNIVRGAKNKANRTVQTNWRLSIVAIASAHHIVQYTSRHRQQEDLAREWLRQGRLGNSLQRRQAGQQIALTDNCILAVRSNVRLRFFEAGNTSPTLNLLVRPGSVPLVHCMQQVDRLQQESSGSITVVNRVPSDVYWIAIA
jgi:hypothetical protein